MSNENPEIESDVLEATGEWIENGDLFFLSAQSLIGMEAMPIPKTACLMAQATAERHLKAFLVFNKLKYREYSHDLLMIIKACAEADKEFEKLKDAGAFLNVYRRQVNYPDMPCAPMIITEHKALEAIEYAGKIREFVLRKLKERGYR